MVVSVGVMVVVVVAAFGQWRPPPEDKSGFMFSNFKGIGARPEIDPPGLSSEVGAASLPVVLVVVWDVVVFAMIFAVDVMFRSGMVVVVTGLVLMLVAGAALVVAFGAVVVSVGLVVV